MGVLRKAKDHLVASAAPAVLNETIMADYGKITRLELDSAAKKLHVEVLLRGESQPIQVEIGSYKIEPSDKGVFLTIQQVTTSREWITTLVRQQLVNKPIALPKQFARWAGRFL